MPKKPPPIEPLAVRLKHLRKERGLSRSALSRATVDFNKKGLAEVTIKALEDVDNQPQAEVTTMEALAHALEVTPDEFVEYRLAMARRALDEKQVGLPSAYATLLLVEDIIRRGRRGGP